MTGRRPMAHSGTLTWKRSMANAIPSFMRLSRFGVWRVISTIIPICKNKKRFKRRVQLWTQQMPSPLSLTDNLWSNIRWQWWQPFFLGACNRTTTWFHHRSSPRCCGKPLTSHLGNPLNSCSTFFRLSMVTKHSTQNMIFTALPRATRCQTACSGDPPTHCSSWWQRQAWKWPLRCAPPY